MYIVIGSKGTQSIHAACPQNLMKVMYKGQVNIFIGKLVSCVHKNFGYTTPLRSYWS